MMLLLLISQLMLLVSTHPRIQRDFNKRYQRDTVIVESSSFDKEHSSTELLTTTASTSIYLNEILEASTTVEPVKFQVERLDAPIERIEIRLIDEHQNNTESGDEVTTSSTEISELTTQTHNISSVFDLKNTSLVADGENRVEEYSKYRKVAYVSDVHLNKNPTISEQSLQAPDTPSPPEISDTILETSLPMSESKYSNEVISTTITTSTTTSTNPPITVPYVETEFPKTNEISAKAWFSFAHGNVPHIKPVTDDRTYENDDIVDLPLEIERNGNADDENEPVEECLENRDMLTTDVVHRLKSQTQRLARLIKKLNKQQQQYCVDNGQEQADNTEYRQCPIWREEKMVHYYKLMRMTYCADYSRWPNATRIKRTYAQYLPLFETLYAFQKSQ